VSDSKKGMKNVFKSFWRKPREESIPIYATSSPSPNSVMSLTVRYKYDRPEAQTLLLADLSFMLKDYETAISMYRLVKEDFKSDKCNMHYAHATLMIATSLFLDTNGKGSVKEIHHQVIKLIHLIQLFLNVSI